MRKHQRSWFSLITFCAITVLIVALGSAVLLAGASVAFAVAHPSPVENVSSDEPLCCPRVRKHPPRRPSIAKATPPLQVFPE